MAGSVIAGFIWPLTIPAFLLLATVASIAFSAHRWRMPMRVPLHLNREDPSEDRKIRRSLFKRWPSLIQYEDIQKSNGRGIFYLGYQRLRDTGRELYLSMDDLTRHLMFFASTGGGKTETLFAWMINPFCWGRGFSFVDGKAQNDTARTVYYLARRFGREDCVEYINFMTGGIPAMSTSEHTTSALGRMFITQQSMILARDLGYKIEGVDSDVLEITKYKGQFPYMSFLDEVGAYYTERIAVQATQVRSLQFALAMASQDQERIESQTSAANVATLMQNAGTKVAGKIVSEDKTAQTISNAAGKEARANMVSLQRRDGVIGTSWIDGDHINIQMENKINVQDLIKLQPGENYTVFQGDPVPGVSFFIEGKEKTCKDPVRINRYIAVTPPKLERLRKLVPRTAQRRLPSPEKVSLVIGVLTAKPSRRRKKGRTEPWKIVDTLQQKLANRQQALTLLTEYDLDVEARELALTGIMMVQ